MRILIGIILGFLIIFNWSSIKDYFDNKITTMSEEDQATKKQKSSKQSEDKKQDLFKEFK